ncbi:class I SAM-dependent methyltransferase [Candidatus Omnitrophota bacterium]
MADQRTFSDLKYKHSQERLQPFKLELLKLLLREEKGRVLDIGCGSGVISQRIKENDFSAIGIDISTEALSKYYALGLKGVVADIESYIPVKSGSFDIIWMSEVIEHVKDYEHLILETYRALKSGGKLYVSAPNSAFFIYRLLYLFGRSPSELQHPHHVHFFSYRMLIETFKNRGFIIEKVFGQNIYGLIPASAVKKLMKKSSRLARVVVKAIRAVGFRYSEGCIHDDKYILSSFSKRACPFFSNTIMLVARKPR